MKCYVWWPAVLLSPAIAFAHSPLPNDWPQWQGPTRDAVSQERGLLKDMAKGRAATRLESYRAGRRRQCPFHRRRADLRHEQSRRRCRRLGPVREGWQETVGDAALARLSRSGCRRARRGRAARRPSTAIGFMPSAWEANWSACRLPTAKSLWQRSLTSDFGGKVPNWSYRESPLVDGAKVICTPGGADATMVALDKMTGKTIWKCAAPGRSDGRLRFGHCHRCAGSARICAAHPRDAHWRRGVGRQIPLEIRPSRQPLGHQLLHAASITTAWCSPPRRMVREAGWRS